MTDLPDATLERYAATLEESGAYRVLRRLEPRTEFQPVDPGVTPKLGLIVDVETTGLDPAKDQVIELGLVAFEFSAGGEVYRVVDTVTGFRDPGIPIPAEITKLTGITDDMVRGTSIEADRVTALAERAVICIAHNAGFDRKLTERFWPVFATRYWGCSTSEIEWKAEGIRSARLGSILADYGLFHAGAHRAADDCQALLEILARPLPVSQVTGLRRLLDNARKTTHRIWAINTDYKAKDALKARGYLWNNGDDGRSKAWWRDIGEADMDAELAWLREAIYRQPGITIPVDSFTALHRHSVRC